MSQEKTQILKFITVAVIGVISILYFLEINKSEVDTCRDILGGLTRGSYSVQSSIAWDKLKAVGADVGAVYSRLPNKKEKSGYRKAFIKSFAQGFKRSGGQLRGFTNWRIDKKDSQKTVVAADYRGKILLFTLYKYGKKVADIQWKE